MPIWADYYKNFRGFLTPFSCCLADSIGRGGRKAGEGGPLDENPTGYAGVAQPSRTRLSGITSPKLASPVTQEDFCEY